MTVVRGQLAEQVKTWVGTGYQHRGTTRFGCDCTGLIIGCLRELGCLGHYQLRQYPFQWNLHAEHGDYICEECEKIADAVPCIDPQPGDIVVFRFGKCRAHAGVITEAPIFVHALSTVRLCCYASLTGRQWENRWERTYRLNGEKLGRFA
jgi:cell wall-associated NlpC family hydrolase